MDASGSGLVDKQHEVVVFIKVSRIDDSNLEQIEVRDHIKKIVDTLETGNTP